MEKNRAERRNPALMMGLEFLATKRLSNLPKTSGGKLFLLKVANAELRW
ncbi:MAG: hypothetical protein M3209_18530 [Acidobacteriota bacterium]|nr:hypothetical protein [Acidobacteriota bacterium]